MDLYSYISLQSFVDGCSGNSSEQLLLLSGRNLLFSVPKEEYLYGLALLKKAIGLYEEQKGIPTSQSKRDIPLFRENRLMLIGPEVDIYKFSFFENDAFIPESFRSGNQPCLQLTFDYEVLVKHCLFENMFLICCKYDEEQTMRTFVGQMDREYDKFFFDEEHSGFTADSRFFSLLCNACLEVKKPCSASEREWRLAVLRSPSEADYRYAKGQLEPSVSLSLPLTSVRRITLLDREKNERNYSALAGFMQSIGLPPERCLEGMME